MSLILITKRPKHILKIENNLRCESGCAMPNGPGTMAKRRVLDPCPLISLQARKVMRLLKHVKAHPIRSALVAAMISLVLWPLGARADIYKYQRPNGEMLITTTPQQGLKLLEIISASGEPRKAASSSSSSATPRSPKAAKNMERALSAQKEHLSESSARRALGKLSGLSRAEREHAFDDLIREASDAYDVPFSFIKGVIRVESNFNPQAVSHAGAQGLMQLMPGTAAGLNVRDPFDPRQNIFGGTKLLKQLIDAYQGDINLILAAYNAGPAHVKRYNGIPWAKTRGYVASVYHWYKIYSAMDKSK